MAITLRNPGTWAVITGNSAVTLPTHQEGDMLIVRVAAKSAAASTETITIATAGWTKIGQGNNGTTNSGNGTGSVIVAAFFKVAESGSETNPTVSFSSGPSPGAVVAMAYQKAAGEMWISPQGNSGPDTSSGTGHSATIASLVRVYAGDVVDFFTGIADDTTMTVPTITQTGVTFDAVTESPATALSSTTGNDISADGGYRTDTSGTATAAAVVTGTLSTAETGTSWMSVLRVMTPPPTGQTQARIKAVGINVHGQTQSTIKGTDRGLGQAQAQIKQTYTNATGQAQASIVPPPTVVLPKGQALASIKRVTVNGSQSRGTAQAQAIIDYAIRSQIGFAQARIYSFDRPVVAQAQANIDIVFRQAITFGLARAEIITSVAPFVYDDFEGRLVTTGLGLAPNGVTWTAAANQRVDDGKALITAASAQDSVLTDSAIAYPTGFELLVRFSHDRIPQGSISTFLAFRSSATTNTLFTLAYEDDTHLRLIIPSSSTTTEQIISFEPNAIYIVKMHIIPTSDLLYIMRGKIWLEGSTEPGWTEPPILNRTALSTLRGPITIDNFNITGSSQTVLYDIYTTPAYITRSGQAQAHIGPVNYTARYGLGQAGAYIAGGQPVYGQANALIPSTYTQINDTFNRAAIYPNGWGIADSGNVWTISAGTASLTGTQGTTGYANTGLRARLNDTLLYNTVVTFDITVENVVTNALHFMYNFDGGITAGVSESTRISIEGSIEDDINRVFLYSNDVALTPEIQLADNTLYRVKLFVYRTNTGTRLAFKVYEAAGAEPGEWTFYDVSPVIPIRPPMFYRPGGPAFLLDSISTETSYLWGWGQAQAEIVANTNKYGHGQAQAYISPVQMFQGAAETVTSDTTTTITVPAHAVGDRLIFLWAVDGIETTVWPSYITQLAYQDNSAMTAEIYYRDVDGSEGWNTAGGSTFDVTISSAEQATVGIVRIRAGFFEPLTPPGIGDVGFGNSTGPNPLTYSPFWGSTDIWLTFVGYDDGADTVTDYPANHVLQTNYISDATGAGVGITARFNTATSENPASYTLSAAEQWVVWTIALRPLVPLTLGRGLGQTQAAIKQVYYGLGQSQAWIENTYRGLGQAQAQIKSVNYAHANAISRVRGDGALVWHYDSFTRSATNDIGTPDIGSYEPTFIEPEQTTYIIDGSSLASIAETPIASIFKSKFDMFTGFFPALPTDNSIEFNINPDVAINEETVGPTVEILLAGGATNAWIQIFWFYDLADDIRKTTFGFINLDSVLDIPPLELGVDYILKSRIVGNKLFAKVWKKSEIEPDWMVSFAGGPSYQTGISEILIVAEVETEDLETVTIDNWLISEILDVPHGQAQADIKQTYTDKTGQAQADIKQTYYGLGQAQAQIKTTYRWHGQAQGWIENTYFGLGQAQGTIKQVYFGLGQAQADIKQTYTDKTGQSQAWIKTTYFALGQTQARIKNTYFGLGQCQADIKQTYVVHGQAQADIKQTYTDKTGQAQADIKQTYFGLGQAQAQIKQTYYGLGQCQAWIETTYNQHGQAQGTILRTYTDKTGQAQANIKTTYYVHGQAQAQIKQTYAAHGQAQAWIETTYFGLGQAEAWIKNTYYGLGQAQGTILTTYFGLGQAQANIEAIVNAYGQAQARLYAFDFNQHGQAQALIAGSSVQFGQAQAKINAFDVNAHGQSQAQVKQTYYGLGQAQATIKTTYYVHGQSQGWIENTYFGLGQAQAQIKQVYVAHGQAEGWIETTYVQHGQAAAWIENTYNGHGQAQGAIKTTYFAHAQAQAKIKGIDVNQHGQAEAYILSGTAVHGQAQGTIKTTYYVHGQCQAQIKTTYYGLGQAQADIKQSYVVHGQANAAIANTYFVHGQGQGYIKALVTSCGQAQAQIKTTYNQHGQAQGSVKAVYYAHGQAQAYILLLRYGTGQSQADIKTTYNQHGQSQGAIKQTYNAHANAQSLIKATINSHGQAQGTLVSTYQQHGQAEALITSGTAGHGQAQAQILTTYQGYAQAQGTIVKAALYGQAQAVIRVVFFFGGINISDDLGIDLTLSDSLVTEEEIEDAVPPQLTLEDSTFGLTLDDDCISLVLEDTLY